jgi:nucleoside phosphorylase/CheY-like chemotaxis protein
MAGYILLIDDDSLHLDIYRERLEHEGYEAVCAASGAEGILSMQKRLPDLVILDLEMPGMPGMEVCEQIRANPRSKNVPILMLTAHSHLESKGLNAGADDYLVKSASRPVFLARVQRLMTKNTRVTQLADEQLGPTIGLITALEKEYAAIRIVFDNWREYHIPGRGTGRRYGLVDLPARNGGKHLLVVLLADMGNNAAASRAALLLEHFPNVEGIIMVGIAGGIPNPKKPDDHVRLGDIVVSDRMGVIQYDFDKETPTEVVPRYPPRPPSPSLLEAVRLLNADEMTTGRRPWLKYIAHASPQLRIARPPSKTDVLARSAPPYRRISHPRDPKRIADEPRIFVGPVASANKLLKNPLKRDALRDKYNAKAVEMEGSGIADATWNHEVGYLVVRGVSDYCDLNKGDAWQDYAAIAAAAYARALLESIPV